MKTIKYNEYQGDGIFINLEIEYIPYQKLIHDPFKYLNINNKYYIYCDKGVKSSIVCDSLLKNGFNVTQVIK